MYHVGSLSARSHDTVLATQVSPLLGDFHFRAFQLGFFLACQELELCDFFCFSLIAAPAISHIHYTKDFKNSQWLSEKFFRVVRNGFVKITVDILWRNSVISYF